MKRVFLASTLVLFGALSIAFAVIRFSPLGPGPTEVSGICSPSNWCWQNPLPQGNMLNSVHFVDGSHGWAVGEHGTILHTDDGGQEWSPQDSGTANMLEDVTFTDSENGWIVGRTTDSERRVLHTTDGGLNWSSGGTFEEACYAVTFMDQNTGWIAGCLEGGYGRILKTTDGGENWVLKYSGEEGARLYDLDFADSQTGWAVGARSTILHTTNGGDTWARQESFDNPDDVDLEEVHIKSLSIVTPEDVWAAGDEAIFHTADGGATWTVRSTGSLDIVDYPPQYPLWMFGPNSIHFVDADNGWAVGDAWLTGAILHTTDGGATWVEQTGWPLEAFLPSYSMGESYGYGHWFTSVTFFDANTGWVVGASGAVFRTTDGGQNWIEQTEGATRVNLMSAAFYTRRAGFAVGSYGVLLQTGDGETWTQRNPDTPGWCHYESIALFGSNIWLVGYGRLGDEPSHGRVFHSRNAGSTWIELTNITDLQNQPLDLEERRLYSIAFVGLSGWIAGDSGIILHTTDGGGHWIQQETGVSGPIKALAFVDEDNGWAISGDVVLHTVDGGANWYQQEPGTTEGLTDIAFIDESTGWAVGPGMILHTTDGGETWNVQVSVLSCALWAQSVSFVDENTGWVVGSGGEIAHTTDGGENWSRECSGTWNGLYDVVAVSADDVWAVGWMGTILHRSEG